MAKVQYLINSRFGIVTQLFLMTASSRMLHYIDRYSYQNSKGKQCFLLEGKRSLRRLNSGLLGPLETGGGGGGGKEKEP
jgi:hypothetical protein